MSSLAAFRTSAVNSKVFDDMNPLFVLMTAALIAFGFAWHDGVAGKK
jgi:hypothetical protein